MKMIFKLGIAVAAGIGIGVPIGWFGRKKMAEVQFVETTEEEQEAAMIANGDGDLIPVKKEDIKRPTDIQAAIDGVFAKPDVPTDLKEKVGAEMENEKNREAGMVQMDTQKEQYFKYWKEAEAVADQYDTRSKDLPDDVTKLPEETEQFVEEAAEEYNEDEHFGDGKPNIDAGSMEDWEHWESKSDGAYDCVEIWWFDKDNVLSDEDGNEIENPGKYLGFDVAEQFRMIDERMTGNEDIRIVYNHKQHAIFKLIRRHTSFSRKRGMEEYGSDYDGDDTEDFLRSRY